MDGNSRHTLHELTAHITGKKASKGNRHYYNCQIYTLCEDRGRVKDFLLNESLCKESHEERLNIFSGM
jgi:hypothetical protein